MFLGHGAGGSVGVPGRRTTRGRDGRWEPRGVVGDHHGRRSLHGFCLLLGECVESFKGSKDSESRVLGPGDVPRPCPCRDEDTGPTRAGGSPVDGPNEDPVSL